MEAIRLHACCQQVDGREQDLVLVPLEANGDYFLNLLGHEISKPNDQLHKLLVEQVTVLNVANLNLEQIGSSQVVLSQTRRTLFLRWSDTG